MAKKKVKIRWLLVVYDFLIMLASAVFYLNIYGSLPWKTILFTTALSAVITFGVRMAGNIYRLVWRFGGIQSYIKLILADGVSFCLYYATERLFERMPWMHRVAFSTMVSCTATTLLASLTIRMVYRYAYKCCRSNNRFGRWMQFLVRVFTGTVIELGDHTATRPIAIVGAGRMGVAFAEELLSAPLSEYRPVLFIETNREKSGRSVFDIPILHESEITHQLIEDYKICEFVLSIQSITDEEKRAVYEKYSQYGLPVKIYDYPVAQSVQGGKRVVRNFDIEELLFRKTLTVIDDRTVAYYRGKTILITGGGGSIGSELCRQIARMQPKKLVILDVYENGAYDVQQELKETYGDALDLSVEVLSICNVSALDRVFAKYRPQIVLNAAAHKHVPLMEHNPIEAIENNVFGTLNTATLAMRYKTEHFIMVSTDKAVNPTNVMGATKRMCEMIIRSMSTDSETVFSATRFGNVLGSAGSVIPLFRRQIEKGGPVTITDKRIIRYFMTIPEAAQLVLVSGAMAQNGQLFVLDMGKPIRILELAESMIRLSGFVPYRDINIVETGLRPGEKLYEELLIDSDNLTKTDNNLIFVESDEPISEEELDRRLEDLRAAINAGDDARAVEALRRSVPTFRTPKEVNEAAENAKEMLVAAK